MGFAPEREFAWIVAGLGNPGPDYEGTRHNVGFEVVDRLASRAPAAAGWIGARRQRRLAVRFHDAEVYPRFFGSGVATRPVLLVKPQAYMNRSGDVLCAICRACHVDVGDLLVIHDDLDFSPGVVRVKSGGGAGGHNGLRSIMALMGDAFLRVRVGVGKPPTGEGVSHVLSPFSTAERGSIDRAVDVAAGAVEAIVSQGIDQAMQMYNRKMPREIAFSGGDDTSGQSRSS